jgi:chaperonin cofactor prefoldin
MAEAQKPKSLDELMKQIEDFENTVKGLAANVAALKQKLLENKEKYGPDMSTWPQEARD